jgi:hypothetical protein
LPLEEEEEEEEEEGVSLIVSGKWPPNDFGNTGM